MESYRMVLMVQDPKFYFKMVKKFLILILVLIIPWIGYSQDLLWKSHLSGTGSGKPYKSTIDRQGNIYITGTFTGNIHQGSFSLNSLGGNDVFIAKYNNTGNLVWIKQI